MLEPVNSVFDRLLVIVMAIVFYLCLKFLQSVQDDIEAIRRNTNERITRIENIIYGGE